MQTFDVTIKGESPDGSAIKAHIKASVHCEKGMAVSLLVKAFKGNKELRDLALEALMICMSDTPIGESMTDEEYKDYKNDLED